MKIILYHLFFLFLLLSCIPSFSQSEYPQNYLRPLFDIPMSLSGNFGQLRPDHYHSGIDLRTGQVEGMPVSSVERGYVSRIKVSAFGFGKVIYVTHPGHFVSVYAHLQGYYGKVKDYVNKYQSDNETFEFDITLDSGLLKVQKGEVIALSGNSGTSGGPHLHFELREEMSEWPVNPLLFGYQVPDTTKPVISAVRIIPVGKGSSVRQSAVPLNLEILKSLKSKGKKGKKRQLPVNDTIAVTGSLKFGIESYDCFNDSKSKMSPYRICLSIDSQTVYSRCLDKFSFAWKRSINSEIDYSFYQAKKRRFEWTCLAPGDHSGIIDLAVNSGIFEFSDGKVHTLVYSLSDYAGNSKDFRFYLKGVQAKQTAKLPPAKKNPGERWFSCNAPNHFERNDFVLNMPAGVLYDSILFRYSVTLPEKGLYSAVHHVHQGQVPLNEYYTISIKPHRLPSRFAGKALVVKVTGPGRYRPAGGEWENGFLNAKVQEFGNYAIAVDTTAPVIKAGNFRPGKKMLHPETILIKISDDLSGIASFYPMVNGKWVLMEYDGKTRSLIYTPGAEMMSGDNLLCLSVWDKKGNTRFYNAVFLKDEKGLKQVP